jgi:hypothetical protein
VLKTRTIKIKCGSFLWAMPIWNGRTRLLAVRIDGKPYFVDGTSLDSHGDAMPMMAFVLLSERHPLLAK